MRAAGNGLEILASALGQQQRKNETMTKWVDDKKKQYCKSGIKYQVGYQPNPDPCATISGSTTTTSQ